MAMAWAWPVMLMSHGHGHDHAWPCPAMANGHVMSNLSYFNLDVVFDFHNTRSRRRSGTTVPRSRLSAPTFHCFVINTPSNVVVTR